ncbi:hypothetical protein CASFOL_041949 [Castilleja foliolosa]|uniref:Uncharacterized protein n=1 Tax=Castilleja foliolosa TaxID=1961234 RepID=A0ABD3B951_9LAMI
MIQPNFPSRHAYMLGPAQYHFQSYQICKAPFRTLPASQTALFEAQSKLTLAKEMSFQSPTKEKALNQKSEMADDKAFGSVLDGGGIGSLSLTKPDRSPYNSEEVGNDVDEELQDCETLFGEDIPLDCIPPFTFGIEIWEMDLAGFAMAHIQDSLVAFNIIAHWI